MPVTVIEILLTQRGMKQKDLARMIGKTPAHISNIINGKTDVSLEKATQIANALNVSVKDIFGVMSSKYRVKEK